ncbi:MAG: GspH/FimT family pseudopilin [Woeseiaceae bacterium]
MRQQRKGFSLYELLVTLTLIAILVGLGMPSFAKITASARLRTEVNALFHAVHVARKESIMRRSVVSICPSIDGRTCTAALDWSDGWIMFNNIDRDEPPALDPNEPILQIHRTGSRVRITANRRGFTLRATQKRATNGTIVVCDKAGRVRPRALVVSYTGRPRVAIEDRRGNNYQCAD